MNKLKKYTAPCVEVREFKNEDIICTSTVLVDGFLKGNEATNVGQVDASTGFFE